MTLRSTGTATVQVSSVAISGANATDFKAASDCAFPLSRNGTCSIRVTFSPTAVGSRSASLDIQISGVLRSVSLRGTGASPPQPKITVTPSSLSFPTQTFATSSDPRVVTVRNTGPGVLRISTITVVGAHASDFRSTNNCAPPIERDGACSISVIFSPGAVGARTASLEIKSNTTLKALSIRGTGAAPPQPRISISPRTLSFSGYGIGTRSAPKVVTVENLGLGRLELKDIGITGPNAANFSVVHDCATLAPNTSCKVSIRFSPTSDAPSSAALTMNHNGSATSSNVSLSGRSVSVSWRQGPGGNFYAFVPAPDGVTWSEAQIATNLIDAPASSQRVTLASLSSRTESDFVWSILPSSAFTATVPGGWLFGPWIGGYQRRESPLYSESRGGWSWADGDAFGFTDWVSGEPNNRYAGEDYVHLVRPNSASRGWNDLVNDPSSVATDRQTVPGFVVEAQPVTRSGWTIGPRGSFYQYVNVASGISWTSARDAAAATAAPVSGYVAHLATITASDEATAINALVPASAFVAYNWGNAGPWIGGYQDRAAVNYSEPASGWRWVTDELWSATRWARFEPNNSFGGVPEDFLHLFYNVGAGQSKQDAVWNDIPANPPNPITGYVVEATPNQLPWVESDSGRFYAYVPVPSGLSWEAAKTRAELMRPPRAGFVTHLATITSLDEAIFISKLVPRSAFSTGATGGAMWGPWLGGYQDKKASNYSEPSGGWRWVTGEPWSFTRWSKLEPNNNFASASEEYLHLSYDSRIGESQRDGVWNDIVLDPSAGVKGFVVEASPLQ